MWQVAHLCTPKDMGLERKRLTPPRLARHAGISAPGFVEEQYSSVLSFRVGKASRLMSARGTVML